MSPRITTISFLTALALVSTPLLPSARGEVTVTTEGKGTADVQKLIAQLGDAKFAARKSAADKLAKIGLPAYQALEDATRDGETVTVRGGSVWRNGTCLAEGVRLTEGALAVALADHHHRSDDLAACISSGSFRTLGVIVAP